MKERPILFSAPMIRALLAGTKTQTRRIAKWKPREPGLNLAFSGLEAGRYSTGDDASGWVLSSRDGGGCWHDRTHRLTCPYGAPGDRLWVRETHAVFSVGEGMDRLVPECVAYRATCADDNSFDYVNTRGEVMGLTVTKWTPAIFMPRWASRITLDIKNIRVERLQELDELDALAEGVEGCSVVESVLNGVRGEFIVGSARDGYANLWRTINGAESWDDNPWVWVVEFKRVADQAMAA